MQGNPRPCVAHDQARPAPEGVPSLLACQQPDTCLVQAGAAVSRAAYKLAFAAVHAHSGDLFRR